MHEVALAQAVWRQVASEMASRPGHRLTALHLVVGDWSGADPESLEFALGLVASESEWPDVDVCICREPLSLVCRHCQRRYETDQVNLACPDCGRMDVEPVAGTEVRLEALEVTTDHE